MGILQSILAGAALLPLLLPGLEDLLPLWCLFCAEMLAPMLAPLPILGGALLVLSAEENVQSRAAVSWWLHAFTALVAGIIAGSLWLVVWGFTHMKEFMDQVGGLESFCAMIVQELEGYCEIWASFREMVFDSGWFGEDAQLPQIVEALVNNCTGSRCLCDCQLAYGIWYPENLGIQPDEWALLERDVRLVAAASSFLLALLVISMLLSSWLHRWATADATTTAVAATAAAAAAAAAVEPGPLHAGPPNDLTSQEQAEEPLPPRAMSPWDAVSAGVCQMWSTAGRASRSEYWLYVAFCTALCTLWFVAPLAYTTAGDHAVGRLRSGGSYAPPVRVSLVNADSHHPIRQECTLAYSLQQELSWKGKVNAGEQPTGARRVTELGTTDRYGEIVISADVLDLWANSVAETGSHGTIEVHCEGFLLLTKPLSTFLPGYQQSSQSKREPPPPSPHMKARRKKVVLELVPRWSTEAQQDMQTAPFHWGR